MKPNGRASTAIPWRRIWWWWRREGVRREAVGRPWLGGMFRRTVHPISRVVRQDVLYTSTPVGETAYDVAEMPCWVDHGYGAYGTPSVEGCGVKAAIVWQRKVIDLDDDERVVDAATFTRTRQYLRHRLPGLAGQRAVDQKACQIAMTPDTHAG